MLGKVGWSGETPGLFFATFGEDRTGLKLYMVVEALPGGGWDWVAWANDGSGRSMHGTASCQSSAMQAAELGVDLMRFRSVSSWPGKPILH